MKKALFLALMASVAFAACTSDESLVPPQEIDFQVAKYLSTSRATGSEFTGSFGTYSFGLGTGKEMDNTEISEVGDVWKAATAYYWPATGTVNFISYAPHIADCPFDIDAETGEFTATDYVVDGSKDLMLADYATDLNGNVDKITTTPADGGYTGVPTLFRHMLSNISFTIALTEAAANYGYTVEITGMRLTGIHNTGSISLSVTGNAENNMKVWNWPTEQPYWTDTSGSAEITITPPTSTTIGKDLTGATLTNCYLLPQAFVDNAQKITITYKLTYNSVEGNELSVTKDLIDLQANHKGWGINKKIVYNIRIGVASNEIYFDPAIAEWSSEDVNVGDITLVGNN